MRRVVAALVAASLTGAVFADGFPIRDGRYEGATTVLRLTPRQVASLAKSRGLRLTSGQSAALKAATGVGPSQVYVYFTKGGENDHACLAYNVGFWFSDDRMEVPHEYVVSDAEAARIRTELAES